MGDARRTSNATGALRLAASLLVVSTMLTPATASASASASESESDAQTVGDVYGFAPLIALAPGDESNAVVRLQTTLKDEGFFRGEITGEYDAPTAKAVIAFHKYVGIERTDSFNALDWIRIALLPAPDIPYRWDEPDRVEIDTTRQLLFVIRDHRIAGILPTSTGSGSTYYSVRNKREVRAATPHGDFELRWRQYGWNCDSITNWCVYNYWAFTSFYGIHGYGNVPAYPASHGCSRVDIWDSDWLDDQLFIGMPVHIWREKPDVPPPPPKPLFERL